jgi:hypothetical protein
VPSTAPTRRADRSEARARRQSLPAGDQRRGVEPYGTHHPRTSLPTVDSGPRPGPDVLYAPPADAPQLRNTGPWRAEPILVSGAQAYRDGEWLYQDFLFDDHGATGVADSNDPYGPGDHLYSPTAGTFTYPTDPVYAHNAADLVELRIRPLRGATVFRVTLNTLQDPELTAVTIALGASDAARVWPHGAGVSSPAERFLTVHGDEAELIDAATGSPAAVAPTASVDLERRQIEIRVPHRAWDPGREVVRTTIGVGLWDVDAGTYLAPAPEAATATTPGGGTPDGVAIVNVGPRFDEPWPLVAGATMADTAAGATATAPWWRERQQSLQLTAGDVTPFSADVDFGKLADRVDDASGIPTTGPINRILASNYVFGQGLDPTEVCYDIGRVDRGAGCVGRFVGQLQPYTLYVPDGPRPEDGYGLTLLLHSLSANYNQYAASRNQSQLGDRDAGSLVVTPGGRGPDGFYKGIAETDTFEVWADVARHYELDPTWTTVSGYSMGGFGTYRLLARYPDLFARGFSVVGRPGSAGDQLASLRHTPLLLWNAAGDELVSVDTAEAAHAALIEAGIRHTYDLFPTADHLTLAGNDEYGLGAAYLGDHRVDRDPGHVTYVVDPREDSVAGDVVADHAYWFSEVTVRDAAAAPTGTIDVRSAAVPFGVREPQPTAAGGGVLTGGHLPALAFVERGVTWAPTTSAPYDDRLEITATNVGHVTIDIERARVSCDVELAVTTDGPLTVDLPGCGTPRAFGR